MKKLLLIGFVFLAQQGFSQKQWTLLECVNHALENNITIQQNTLNLTLAELNVKNAKGNFYPNLNASTGGSFSFGSSFDPVSNDRVSNNVFGGSISVNSGVTVFNGFRNLNTYKQAQLGVETSKLDLEKIKNDISLFVVNAYLNILFAKENYNVAKTQSEISKTQYKAGKERFNAGAIAKGELLNLESSLANDLQNVIKQRVISDVRYSFEKTKKRPPNDRIKVIVETAIKDGIIDVIRDYRYKFIKKSQSIGEQCEQKYQDFGFVMGHNNDNFDARGFFQDDFKSGFLTSNNEVLVNQITNAVSKSKEKKLNELDREIEGYIRGQFRSIEEDIKTKASKVSNLLIESFFETLNYPLDRVKQKLQNEERILQEQIKSFEENDENRAELSISIHKKIKELDSMAMTIKGLK